MNLLEKFSQNITCENDVRLEVLNFSPNLEVVLIKKRVYKQHGQFKLILLQISLNLSKIRSSILIISLNLWTFSRFMRWLYWLELFWEWMMFVLYCETNCRWSQLVCITFSEMCKIYLYVCTGGWMGQGISKQGKIFSISERKTTVP